ncbi:MAG: T9SS type A sorting domain-containing protein, partial [bacterium]
LDTRDHPGTYLSALYYSYSQDGGTTWSVNERLSIAFNPHIGWPQQNKMGDYFDMVSYDSSVHLAWAATFNGEQDVYYARITPFPVAIEDQKHKQKKIEDISLLQNYPNPFNPTTVISYQLAASGPVKLTVHNLIGQKVATLVDERQTAGVHSVVWNASGLASGVYLYRLEAGNYVAIRKMISMR